MARSTRLIFAAWVVVCSCTVRRSVDVAPVPSHPASAEPASRKEAAGAVALSMREARLLRRFQVTAPDNRFRVQVRAASPPSTVAQGDSVVVEMPIGSNEPIRCEVFDEALRPASTFARLFATASKTATVERVEPWTVEVIKETPITFARLFYSADGRRGTGVGELKVALHAASTHPVLCYHDEVGFEQTFLDEARAFSQSVTHAGGAAVAPAFTTIRIARANGAAVGFEQTSALRDRDPARIVATSALMVPASPTDLRFLDTEIVEHIDTSGRIVDGVWSVIADGVTKLELELARERPRVYRYSGELDGSPLSGRFELRGKELLREDAVPLKKLAEKVLTEKSFVVDFVTYAPLVDPTRALHGSFHRSATDPPFTVRWEVGDVSSVDTVDELGLLKDGELVFGEKTLLLERVFERGTPWGR